MGRVVQTEEKYHNLLDGLKQAGSVLVAFSGGVDSTFLVAAAKASGVEYLAVTAISPTMPKQDHDDVKAAIEDLGIKHRFITGGELSDRDFVANPPDRCFYCKQDLFTRLSALARAEGFAVVLDGSTTDDLADYRPGARARDRLGVRSPIQEAGLSKQEVRQLSRTMGLKSWDKPASPCLSSRIVYGEPIVPESLRMVEQAENFLKKLQFSPLRVRKQGDTARIEVLEDDIAAFLDPDVRKKVTAELKKLGFKYVTLDMEGFISGKLNRVIS